MHEKNTIHKLITILILKIPKFQLIYINIEGLLNPVLFLIKYYQPKTQYFQLISLLSKISAEKLQNTLFKLVSILLIIYTYTHFLMFFSNTSDHIFFKTRFLLQITKNILFTINTKIRILIKFFISL